MLKKNKTEILEKKSSKNQIKNSVERLSTRMDQLKTDYQGLRTR
jgi:archaellum component FlaC